MTVENVGSPLTVVCAQPGISVDELGILEDRYRLLKERTEIFPSEEAQARIAPSSCGAQETEFTVVNPSAPSRCTPIVFYLRRYEEYVP